MTPTARMPPEPASRPPLLCTLSAGGAGVPLYLVPSVGSTPLSLARLARTISPPRPVYAFAYAGLEDDGPPHRTLPAMAAAYVAELLACSPQGPSLIGGHCLGGAVALEIALELEARGREVAGLVVLDAIAPLLADARGESDLAALATTLRKVLEELVVRTVSHTSFLDPDVARRLHTLLALHIEAGVAYRARPLRAPIHVLCTGGSDGSIGGGWAAIAAGVLVRHDVPGDTFSMLRPPHVEVVGRQLGRALEALAR